MTSFPVSTRPEVVFRSQTVLDRSIYCIKSNRKSGTASSFMLFPPYFYFRFEHRHQSGVVQRRFFNLLRQISRPLTVTVTFDVERRTLTLFPVLPKPEVVFNSQTVADRIIYCIKVEQEVRYCEFIMAAQRNMAGHYIFIMWFLLLLLLSFFLA